MRPILLAASAAALLASSCAAPSRRVTPTGITDPVVHGLAVEPPPRPLEIADYRSWTKVNPRRFRSKGHGYLWVDVYVDRAHAAAYADRSAPAPVGFEVVMAGFETADGEKPTGLTVMAKMPPGYDPPNADWYYAVYDPDGKTATVGGKLDPCNGCHVHARPRDFLYGVIATEESP